jgi:hypothetical protein
MSTSTTPPAADLRTGAEQFKESLLSVVNDLLDGFYAAYPNSTYGADYDGPGAESGSYYFGRDGDSGVDYLMRVFTGEDPRNEEKAYIYGNYGWMDAGELATETEYLRQAFEQAVELGVVDKEILAEYDAAVEQFTADLREYREQFDLSDIAALFQNHEEDTLQTLLGHGEEESRIVWSLLNSKTQSGDYRENPIDVPVISEQNRLMLVRAVRIYEGDEYPYAAVVGYDDTPERFFAHRLSSESDIQDPETEWTAEMVKAKMGFDANLWEIDGALPPDTTVRVQGDLAVTRRDYDAALAEYTDTVTDTHRTQVAKEYVGAFHEANPEYEAAEDLSVSTSYLRFRTTVDSTEALKELQDELDIDEEDVRAMQDVRDYSRLTAKRRAEIIEDICERRLEAWAIMTDGQTPEEVRHAAEEEATAAFTDTPAQYNDVFGNHPVIANGVTPHPNRRLEVDGDVQEVLVVPEEGQMLLMHDEHDSQQLGLEPGLYEISFLSGYEDEWWMDN